MENSINFGYYSKNQNFRIKYHRIPVICNFCLRKFKKQYRILRISNLPAYNKLKQPSNSNMSKRKSTNLCENAAKDHGKLNKRFKQKQVNSNIRWECRICHSLNEDANAFCVQCYIGLHYYLYVNMHMFVARDNSYEELYYHKKVLDTSRDSSSLHSNDSQSQQFQERQDVKIDWVQNLLQGE